MKILSIGNSFSQDAQRYLHKIAKNEGENIKCVNLCIGGCPLSRHYKNMLLDAPEYELEFNGAYTGFKVSIKQALCSDDWDYVTLQQVSRESMDFDKYMPYLTELADYIRKYLPKTKILMHQTWAYEKDSKRLTEELGFTDPHQMLDKIKDAYDKAAKAISADGIIPSGVAMQAVLDNGLEKIHRDTFHADLGVGRYLVGLVWYMTLTEKTVQNEFKDFDIEVSTEAVKRAIEAAEQVCKPLK